MPVEPGKTVLAQGKGPPVASPAGGPPLELAPAVGAAKPVGRFLTLFIEILSCLHPGIVKKLHAVKLAGVDQPGKERLKGPAH
eukprot:5405486-Amphidinium_carterae.2